MYHIFSTWRVRLCLTTFVTVLFILPEMTGEGKMLAQGGPAGPKKGKHAPHELLIQFSNEATDEEIEQVLQRGLLRVLQHVRTGPMRERGAPGLTLAMSNLPVEEAMERLSRHPAIDFVEPNWIYETQEIADDTHFLNGRLWGMYGDASLPANEFGSKAAQVWAGGVTGSSSIYVGIIDTGVEVGHADLKANAWQNPFDPVNGKDRDGNGYVDDTHGWNFYHDNRNVFVGSEDKHGTHVAGTIAAKGGNAIGVAGVNWQVNFINAKFLGSDGGYTFHAVQAVDYMVDLKKRHGLNIVALNASWGGGGYSRALHEAILRAAKADILFVAAAGNSGEDNDQTLFYPASYDTLQGTKSEPAANYNSVIAVAAIDKFGKKATFSNYGAKRVHLGAPGVSIYSTIPSGSYGGSSGTSMAAPHVTGAAALYASYRPNASAAEIRNAILKSVMPTASLKSITVTGGRLDLAKMFEGLSLPDATQAQVPPAPTGVTASCALARVAGNATVLLEWNASSGASGYNVRRNTSLTGSWKMIDSNTPNTVSSKSVQANGSTFYFTVSALNTNGEGEASAVVSVRPHPPTPANLKANPISSREIELSWADRSSNEHGFRIESSRNGADFSEIGTVGKNARRFTAGGLLRNRTYWFRVQAFTDKHETDWSDIVSATTLP